MKFKLILMITGLLILAGYLSSCQSEAQQEFDRYYVSGRLLYQSKCQNCHGDKGQGLGQLMPPLTDSAFLHTYKTKLACYIKYGVNGTMTVNKSYYSTQMPAQSNLSPIEIATVLTYVKNSFGQAQGLYNIDQVNVDLKKCE
jgi:mono/diheme cytochrome c family protein